ncbi:hypothetical protein LIA77_00905 [Sarocladium implicatum]|nr:hypothetical protein LIA77_00905 [Sarocladium implicatum]
MSTLTEPVAASAAAALTFLSDGWRYSCVFASTTFSSLSHESVSCKTNGMRIETNGISTLEGAEEHTTICDGHAEVPVEQRVEKLPRLSGFHLCCCKNPATVDGRGEEGGPCVDVDM